jgi:hypothetical protein
VNLRALPLDDGWSHVLVAPISITVQGIASELGVATAVHVCIRLGPRLGHACHVQDEYMWGTMRQSVAPARDAPDARLGLDVGHEERVFHTERQQSLGLLKGPCNDLTSDGLRVHLAAALKETRKTVLVNVRT